MYWIRTPTKSMHECAYTAMEFLLTALFLLLFSLIFLYLYLDSRTRNHNKKGFKIYPIVGSLPEFMKNRHRYLEWTTQVLRECPTNTSVLSLPGTVCGVITANPDNVEHILKTRFDNYPKGERMTTIFLDFLGRGIFNTDGELWKIQRKTASYEFNTKSLRNFVMETVTLELQNRLLPIFSRASQTDRILDLQDLLERFTFDNICKLAFNVDPGCLGGDATSGAEFMSAIEDAMVLSSGRFMTILPIIWKIKKLLNIGTERRLRECIARIRKFADEIIQSRSEAKDRTQNEDLLSRFINVDDNSSTPFLRDIIISFILAGRDTTSSAVTWFFWIISSRREVQKKIINEIESVKSRSEDKTMFSYEALKEMHYLHAAISETMRLYPPVAADTKECLNDDILPDGTVVKKDWFVTYHTYGMGRMESLWGKDWAEYKPERWLEKGVYRTESSFCFPVFHAGPRICLGKDMAYIQMKSIAASVIEKFEIDAVDKDNHPKYNLSFTLRMKGGFPVKLRARARD